MEIQIAPPAPPHSSTAYTDWARAQGPAAEETANGLLDEVRGSIHRAHEKPGRFVDGLERRVRELDPAHLPWFWDTVGHRLISWHARSAARAYTLARTAEQTHGLAVDPDWHRANVLVFAAGGALPAAALGEHQAWLAGRLEPAAAHEEYVRVLRAWAASPGDLPADLARRVRLSARAAGLGPDEEARVLGLVLGAARGKSVPDRLLDAARDLLAAHPQGDATDALLLDLFPETRGDGSAWLRLLLACGAVDAAVAGRIVPQGGTGAWFGRYTERYSHRPAGGGGVTRQPLPDELFDVLARLAPRLRAAAAPLTLHEDRYQWPGLDAELLDACLAEGIAVVDPGPAVGLVLRDGDLRRDLLALAADPVFGPRLEGTVHAGLRGSGTAVSRLPRNPGITAEVHSRIEALLDALRGGGLAAADEAVRELDGLLDRPTARALDGIEEALARLDLTGPLARALRAGLPEEWCWPALEEAVAGFGPGGVTGVTSTWPVLTVHGRGRAVAVDHAGPRGSCTFRLPDDAAGHTVHHVGGRFLVSWADRGDGSSSGERAFWADRPDEVFEPEQKLGLRRYGGMIQGGLGYQFETPDGGGRHDGERVLRPGGREGVGSRDAQMSDGRGMWTVDVFGSAADWTRIDPATGAPLDAAGTGAAAARRTRPADGSNLPAFHTAAPLPPGTGRFGDLQTLAPLPPGAPDSPLGQDGRLVGCRVLYRTPYAGPSPTSFVLEGIDGRTAVYRSRRWGRRPWAIVRMPSGGEDAVLAGQETFRAHAAEDNSLLWQTQGFPGSGRRRTTGFGDAAGPFPPPAFWHFLTPRCAASSTMLRAVADTAVRDLLDAALRGEPAPALPATPAGSPLEPGIAAGVARAAVLAADVLRRRRALSHKVAVMRAAPVVALPAEIPDSVLVPALYGLLPDGRPRHDDPGPAPQPALLTAVDADGRHLRGEIDDETRVLALPAAPGAWQALLGGIGAAAWRAAVATTPDPDRDALVALLRTWSGQPYAVRGSSWRTGRATPEALAACRAAGRPLASGAVRDGMAWFVQPSSAPAPAGAADAADVTVGEDDAARLPRLLALLSERGPVAVERAAVEAFARLTGVRAPVAALVLAGFPGRERHDEHLALLGSAPYRAGKGVVPLYDEVCRRLGADGRRTVLAAGLPGDPAELWEPAATTAAAERMAAAWNGLLGAEDYADEELATALAADLGLPDGWARSLPAGHAPGGAPYGEAGFVLTGDRIGGLVVRHRAPERSAWGYVRPGEPAHRTAASVIAWALTERPVGDPAARGALALYGRLRDRLDDPGTLVPLGGFEDLAATAATDPAFVPYEGEVRPCPEPLWEKVTSVSTAADDGLFVVAVPAGDTFLRPAALADPARLARAEALAAADSRPWLLTELRKTKQLLDGLGRLVARASDTPVPGGGYENNPALSAPELVEEVASALGTGPDAAALYLQLLALARPTDRAVRRWNGWTAARHKAAQAELLATGAVEAGKRARAGRTLFAPGPWVRLKAPHLPVESDKLPSHLASASGTALHAPLLRLLPVLPPHEQFAEAWARTRAGTAR
ncbi:hypothetical protein HYE82_18895 [Streptomyces sp. BR123]|uniref:hypothetical protein n=1 Tax=Streptomyces sp. BR123 TaxID=2749828 RepID=UPI0015C46D6C|nr:hypothetical protein [Streptomyces sp. BR123]NXY96421.1 hypothetical protein [Streptomyces sp. BR123]